jgi:hypothetical protein
MVATVLGEPLAVEWGDRRVVAHNGAPSGVAIEAILAVR